MNPRELVEQLSRDDKLAAVMREACAMYGLELVMSDHVRNLVRLQPVPGPLEVYCRGSWQFNNNCGVCPRCRRTKPGGGTPA